MKMSDALVLKAEWWVTNLPDEVEVEEVLGILGFDNTALHMHKVFGPDWDKLNNRDSSVLCLLEAAFQKDEEKLHAKQENLKQGFKESNLWDIITGQ